MRALSHRNDVDRLRVIQVPNGIGENPGSVDDHFRTNGVLLSGLPVPNHRPAKFVIGLNERYHFGVVGRMPAQVVDGAKKANRQPRIVELAIEINNSSLESVCLYVGQWQNHFSSSD